MTTSRRRRLVIAVVACVAVASVVLVLTGRLSHRARGPLIGVNNALTTTAAIFRSARSQFGQLGAQRIYYPGALPASYRGSECAAVEQETQDGVTCVISYKDGNLESNNLMAFVRTVPATVNVWLVFHHEPERNQLPPPAVTAQSFVSEFARNAATIRSAAGCTDCHVKVAMIANSFQYQREPPFNRGTSCSFIPPASSVDVYLVDIYEPDPTGEPLDHSPVAEQWDDWLHCVHAANATATDGPRPFGIAEYGLGSDSSDSTRARTIAADNTYLSHTLDRCVLWSYWDVPGTKWSLTGHPAAAAAWRAVVSAHRP